MSRMTVWVSAWIVACAPVLLLHAQAPPAPAPATATAQASSSATTTASTSKRDRAAVANPYAGNAAAIAQGQELFEAKACSGCHGAEGAGGMCPSLVNDSWVYASDDATLFNFIKRGSVGLRAAGYTRGDREKVAGDMPPLGSLVSDEEAWQLLAWVRSKYAGNTALRNW